MTDIASAPNTVSSYAATVRTFFRLLEEGDIDGWMELWAENADHYYPYGTEMFQHHMVGKDAIYEHWKGVPGMFDTMSFPIDQLWTDGDTVIAKAGSDNLLKSGRRYRNSYICLFKFDEEGKIREYWEYFDPIIAGVDFGLAEVTYTAK